MGIKYFNNSSRHVPCALYLIFLVCDKERTKEKLLLFECENVSIIASLFRTNLYGNISSEISIKLFDRFKLCVALLHLLYKKNKTFLPTFKLFIILFGFLIN